MNTSSKLLSAAREIEDILYNPDVDSSMKDLLKDTVNFLRLYSAELDINEPETFGPNVIPFKR